MTLLLLLVLAMPQPFGDLEPCSHELFIGQPRTGKTWHARRRVASARRVVFFSTTLDYVEDGERMEPIDFTEAELEGVTCRIAVIAGRDADDDPAEEFGHVVQVCRNFYRSRPGAPGVVLVGDEVGDYSQGAALELNKLHRNGHHDGIASILVSQTAVDIPLTCRRTATRVVSLLQTRSEDLAALAREYGEEFAERARLWRRGMDPAVWTLPTFYP